MGEGWYLQLHLKVVTTRLMGVVEEVMDRYILTEILHARIQILNGLMSKACMNCLIVLLNFSFFYSNSCKEHAYYSFLISDLEVTDQTYLFCRCIVL